MPDLVADTELKAGDLTLKVMILKDSEGRVSFVFGVPDGHCLESLTMSKNMVQFTTEKK